MNALYLMFVLVALGAIVTVCVGLIAIGAYGMLWLIGHGHVEVKRREQTEEDATGSEEADVDQGVVRGYAFGQGLKGRAHARARGVRLRTEGGDRDHVQRL